MNKIHNTLMTKNSAYAAWHNQKYHKPVHWVVLLATGLLFTTLVLAQIAGVHGVKSAASSVTCDKYVTTTGTASGNGSASSPWNLQTALSGSNGTQPGQTICIRAGTYNGRFLSNLNGTVSAPITVRAYPGERVTIDGYKRTTLGAASGTIPSGEYDTTITVTDPSVFYPGLNARFNNILGEQFIVRSINGNVLNVTRGWNGTCQNGCGSYPSGTIIQLVDNVITVEGSHTIFRDLEVTIGTQVTRVSTFAGSDPKFGGVEFAEAFVDKCDGCKYINNILHDLSNGIGSHAEGKNSVFYGNITYNNGWQDTSGDMYGHGMYIQNTTNFPTKIVKHNISFHNANYGYQSYGDAGGIDSITYDGNIAFDSGDFGNFRSYQFLIGRDGGFKNSIIQNNMVYGTAGMGSLEPCYSGATTNNARFTNNYIAGIGANMVRCNGTPAPIFTGNTIMGPENSGYAQTPNNTYSATYPTTGLKTFVMANEYETGRANIAVYNWAMANSVSVDISAAGLSNGQSYEIRDAQNYFGTPVASGTYTGAVVSIPMTSTYTPPLIGNSPRQPFHTSKQFGAFVLIPTTAGTGAPAAPVINSFTASAMSGGSSTLSWNVTGATSLSINNGVGTVTGTSSTPVSPTTTTTYTLTATNAAGASVTANATVTVTTPQPTGTLTATNCTIASGASTCNSSVTWTTSNLISGANTAVTRDNPNGTQVSTNTSGTSVSNTVKYGTSNYFLYHNNIQLATKAITASCASGTTWNNTICATTTTTTNPQITTTSMPPAQSGVPYTHTFTATGGQTPYTWAAIVSNSVPSQISSSGVFTTTLTGTSARTVVVTLTDATGRKVSKRYTLRISGSGGSPTGTINATNCTIASGASTCNSSVTWTTSNLISGANTAVTRDNPTGTQVSTNTSGTNVSNTVKYGTSNYFLYHNNVQLATKAITASCATGTTWNNTTCATTTTTTSSPIAKWSFNEGSGTTAADSSGNNRNGTLVGSPTWVTGKVGGALQFGSGKSINVPDTFPGNSAYTEAAWIKTSSDGWIIGQGETSDLRIVGGKVLFQIYTDSGYQNTYSNASVNNGQWRHVAVTVSGNTIKIYIDGQLDKSSTFSGTPERLGFVAVGARADGSSEGFTGIIDEVYVYNKALTASEIQALIGS